MRMFKIHLPDYFNDRWELTSADSNDIVVFNPGDTIEVSRKFTGNLYLRLNPSITNTERYSNNMTKMVRIENADAATNKKVVVEQYTKYMDNGEEKVKLMATSNLDYPCQITAMYLTKDSYLVIREEDK